jgi:hypothetical protein
MMKTSPSPTPPRRRNGGGYKLGPRPAKPTPAGALWITSNQLCARYGGRSKMWLWRKLRDDPDFPKPVYDGRLQMFSVAAFDEYDRLLISKKIGSD